MIADEVKYYFKKIRRKYLALRIGEVFFWSLSAASVSMALLFLISTNNYLNFTLSSLAGFLIFIGGVRKFGLLQLNDERIVSFINSRYLQLEQSTDLLLKASTALSPLEQLQREKTIDRFNEIYPMIRLPHRLGQSILLFIGSLGVTFLLTALGPLPVINSATDLDQEKKPIPKKTKAALPVSIIRFSVTIVPPIYTKLKTSTSENPDLIIAEGSRVNWDLQFSDSIRQAIIVVSGRDTLKLAIDNERHTNSRTFTESGFYTIVWKTFTGETKASNYYKIEVIPDHDPEIKINNLKQSTGLSIKDKLSIDLKTMITDDYRISDSYIIATVSKGSGESVKFREEKLAFTTPDKIEGRQINASRHIDLIKLGLEPGDELYFYVEALDNKQPVPNRSRTETYFIALQDTASENFTVDAGLGVDLMPEYFRSQRQIIIDTEKLIKQKKKITLQSFKFTSNELGYDQKVLRLKYGEFLGEEFESQLTKTEDPVTQEGNAQEVTEEFGHAHDKDNEHNLVEEKKSSDTNKHDEEQDPEKKADPIKEYKHTHDKSDEATFFTQSIRAKLKAALTVMWDAELQLRLFEPDKSLPYQYKALKLLKEISNDSRIYVHKTGFDPPPIKEDKRLSGDLAEIRSTEYRKTLNTASRYQGIVQALKITEVLLHQGKIKISASEKQILLKAASELSALALEQPGEFLTTLSLIRALTENEVEQEKMQASLSELRSDFSRALPNEIRSPDLSENTHHSLDYTFIKKLEAIRNE